MTTQRSQLALSGERGLLAIGFLALTGAIAVAHASPATGYELSLYAATPTAVWGLLGLVFCLSLPVSLGTSTAWVRRLALCLGAGATLAIVGMPVLRGYWFISGGDAHTHLGWARGIESGAFHPMDLRYPGLHTVTTTVGSTLGIELAHAMMLVIVALCGLFFLFVSLSTSVVLSNRYSTVAGAFSAFLLLPITTLSTHIAPHAMSQAILFSAAVVYILLRYVRVGTDDVIGSPYGLLTAIALIALVIYHPQLAAHLLVVMVGICTLQWLARRYRRSGPIATHAPLYGLTLLLCLAFVAWSVTHELIQSVIQFHLTSTLEYLLGSNDAAGDSVSAQADSLGAVGGSLLEIVLKLLGPHLVFGLLSGAFVLWAVTGTETRERHHTRATVQYATVGLVGLSVVFFLYFFGSSGSMYFRVFGFMMLFITVLGAASLAYGLDAIGRTGVSRVAHIGFTVAFVMLLALSLVAVFPAPYIYSASPHVTEQSMAGYEAAFESTPPDAVFDGIRSGPNRYADAHDPGLERTRRHGGITSENIEAGLPAHYSNSHYVTVTASDWGREVHAYQELRYSKSHFATVSTQPGVERVQSNGDFSLYYVPASESS